MLLTCVSSRSNVSLNLQAPAVLGTTATGMLGPLTMILRKYMHTVETIACTRLYNILRFYKPLK